MNYAGMPAGMWALFGRSFQRNLTSVLGYDKATAKGAAKTAKKKYREIIASLPDFEQQDIFRMNIVSCAMFSAFCLSVPGRHPVGKMADYYRDSMMTGAMKWFCRRSGRKKFGRKDTERMAETAALKAADRNRYSWNMDYLPYPDGSGYEARFSKCGICTLMTELGLREYVPAMCRLDYTMSEAGGTSVFKREYTLASGGPYCDCGYRKKGK